MNLTILAKATQVVLFFVTMFVVSGCGSSATTATTTTTTGSSSISTIDELPNTTDPVVSSATSSLSLVEPRAVVAFGEDTTLSDFSGGSGSYGACEMVNRMRGAIGQAAQGAMIMCFMQQLLDGNEDVYDGEYHAFDLSFSDGDSDEGAPDHVKVKVVRDSDDTITAFELFACTEGVQTTYFSGSVDGADITVINKGSSDTEEGSVEYAATVTGEVNASGLFVGEKVIDLAYINDFTSGNGNFCDTTTTATDDEIQFSGYCTNTGDNTGSEAIFALATLEDSDSANIETWGIGAGAAKINSDNNTEGEDVEQGWDANGMIDASSTFLSDSTFTSGTIPVSSNTAPDVSYGSQETYDCGDTAEATISNTIETLSTACEDYMLTQDHIECQDGTDI